MGGGVGLSNNQDGSLGDSNSETEPAVRFEEAVCNAKTPPRVLAQ